MGAKLICNLHEKDYINTKQAEAMLSYCSISGPMFIVGTIGVSVLSSYKAGIVILISNIVASLINGLFYRNKEKQEDKPIVSTPTQLDLSGCVYDSLISILMVGAFIVLSFLIIDVLKNVHIISGIASAICFVFRIENVSSVEAVLAGVIEITRGIIDLSSTSISIQLKTIISSALIGFGGISVLMQSLAFLSKLKIKTFSVFKQKLTQGLICLIVSIPLAYLIL